MKNFKYSIIALALAALTACGSKKEESPAEEPHEEENRVEFTEAQFKTAGVTFGKIELKNISASIPVNGLLDVPPQNLVSVSALLGGFIKSTVLLQGMKVRKGEIIATIQNPDFIQIQQDYLDNKSKLKYAEQELKRQEELMANKVGAQQALQQVTADYNSLKAANSALIEKLNILGINPAQVENGTIKSTISIKAPSSGYVTAVNVNVGKYVNPQDVICQIVDTDHLHVELTVFEKDIYKIKAGQKVRFLLVNESNKERTAKVYLINREISPERTVRVHAHLDTEDHSLIPNTYLKAFIEVTDNKATALPEQAVVSSEGKFYIFIKDDGHGHKHEEAKEHTKEIAFTAIEVKTGITQGGYTEVILPEGFETDHAEVVITGAYDLLSKMNNPEEGEGHAH